MTDPQTVHWDFEQASDVAAELGENPVWCGRENCIWWVDISGRRLLKTSVETARTTTWPMPEETGFVVLATGGAVIVGMESGLFRFDPADATLSLLVDLPDPRIRFNDAAVDDRGRLWAAVMDIRNLAPIGCIYRIDPDLSLHPVETGLRTPNGLAADAARGRLYFSDSHKDVRTVWTAPFDPAGGALGEKQVFARLPPKDGRPDGAAIDRDGTYWIAGVDGGGIHAFSPDGQRIATVPTPVRYPTKIAFGGPDLATAFVTSKKDPETGRGGCLISAPVTVTGRSEMTFGWRADADGGVLR